MANDWDVEEEEQEQEQIQQLPQPSSAQKLFSAIGRSYAKISKPREDEEPLTSEFVDLSKEDRSYLFDTGKDKDLLGEEHGNFGVEMPESDRKFLLDIDMGGITGQKPKASRRTVRRKRTRSTPIIYSADPNTYLTLPQG